MSTAKAVDADRAEPWSFRIRRSLPPGVLALGKEVKRRLVRASFTRTLLAESIHDFVSYRRWYHDGRRDRLPLQRESALLKQFHSIEKGLSLSNPRPGFGAARAKAIAERIDAGSWRGEAESIRVAAEDCLRAFHDFSRARGQDLLWLRGWLDRRGLLDGPPRTGDGGTTTIRRSDVHEAVRHVDDAFFKSRHSVRHFSDEPVPIADIERAVDMARKSPSVCNRQGARAYCFQDAAEALRWQPGNAGFGHLASRALVVTCDLQAFCSPGERHQAYVDGGLFAMSLVYALHALGYGTCMLAWSQEREASRKAKAALGIGPSETIIMMIAVGCLPETLEVARSYRRSVPEILQVR